MGEKIINFVERAEKIHGNKYDYSLVKYVNIKTYVDIICDVHGIFKQRPDTHLGGAGCKLCDYENRLYTEREYLSKAFKKHGDKYDYSKVKYTNSKNKIEIICKIHGVFEQVASTHIRGAGCPKCAREFNNKSRTYTTEEFIEKSQKIHGNKYDYSLVDYVNGQTKVKIICKKHGIFTQRPTPHTSKGDGCPNCAFYDRTNKDKKELSGYRTIVRRLTKENLNELHENWNGYDYYDGEYIRDNFRLKGTDREYPTIDHKISIYYGFLNNIEPKKLARLDNLCITKRGINTSKGKKCTSEFKIKK